jgi:hypothetical protein
MPERNSGVQYLYFAESTNDVNCDYGLIKIIMLIVTLKT